MAFVVAERETVAMEMNSIENSADATRLALALTTAIVYQDAATLMLLQKDIGEFIGLPMPQDAAIVGQVWLLAVQLATDTYLALKIASGDAQPSELLQALAAARQS